MSASPVAYGFKSPATPKSLGTGSEKRSPSETSQLFKEIHEKVMKESDPEPHGPSSQASPNHASAEQDRDDQADTPPSISLQNQSTVRPTENASPISAAMPPSGIRPPIEPQEQDLSTAYPSHFIYNYPLQDPEESAAVVTFQLDAESCEDMPADLKHFGTKFAVAMPPRIMQDMLHFLTYHELSHDNPLKDINIFHPIAQFAMRKLTSAHIDDFVISTVNSKTTTLAPEQSSCNALRKSGWSSAHTKPIPPNQVRKSRKTKPQKQQKPTHKIADAFCAAKARELKAREMKQREAYEIAHAERARKRREEKRRPGYKPPPRLMKEVSQKFDEKGKLALGSTKMVPVESDLSSSSSDDDIDMEEEQQVVEDEHQLVEDEQQIVEEDATMQDLPTEELETPKKQGWKFASLIPSSVTRLIPGFRSREATTPQQTPQQGSRPTQRAAATEPRLRPHTSTTQGRELNAGGSAQSTNLREVRGGATLLTKEASARKKKKKDKRKSLEKRVAELQKTLEEKDKTLEKNDMEIQGWKMKTAIAQKGRGTATNPWGMRNPIREDAERNPIGKRVTLEKTPQKKLKRTRPSSPDEIPNPTGVSYGMNMDYFPYDSTDSEDEQDDQSPASQEPSSKRKRTSAPVSGDNDDSFKPKPLYDPYPRRPIPENWTVGQVLTDRYLAGPAPRTSSAVKDKVTPEKPLSSNNTFKVPSPSSSDDEYEYDESYIEDPDAVARHEEKWGRASAAKLGVPPPSSTNPPSSPPKQPVTFPAKAAQSAQPARPARPAQSMAPPAPPAQQAPVAPMPSATEISLNRQREQALKYAAKTPSRLQQSQRLSTTSTAPPDSPYSPTTTATPESTPTATPSTAAAVRHPFAPRSRPQNHCFTAYFDYQEHMTDRAIKAIEYAYDYETNVPLYAQAMDERFRAWQAQEKANKVIRASEPVPVSARVKTMIDSQASAEEDALAAKTFNEGFQAFLAAR